MERSRVEEHYSAALVTHASAALFYVDERRRCMYVNPAAEGLTGYSLEELRGGMLHDFIHSRRADGTECPLDECPLERAIRRRIPLKGEETFAHKSGHAYLASYAATPLTTSDGAPAGTVLELTDLRERERQEARIRESAQRKDEFLALIGHELRNPLAPILTALQVMKLRGETASERERTVIERQVRHMVQLVEDLLDISRITRGKLHLRPEVVETADLVTRSVELASPLLEEYSHRLTITVPRTGMTVLGDPARLVQVLANLLTNAAKYTPRGGHIAVSGEHTERGVAITVEDDGIGIPPEMQSSIFAPFTQGERGHRSAAGGLGLGLSLVGSLVALHEGSIRVHSDGAGRGSRFTVELPRSPKLLGLTDDAPGSSRRHVAVKPRRVLVVDDNQDAALMLADALRTQGHEVAVAHDGPQALRCVFQFTPEVAILDIGLPVMDGCELAEVLCAQLETKPRLIALTGYGEDNDRERTQRAGFDAHLVKPVDLDDLSRLLEDGDLPTDAPAAPARSGSGSGAPHRRH